MVPQKYGEEASQLKGAFRRSNRARSNSTGITNTPEVELVAVYDVIEKKARKLSGDYM